jgi:hypothetical protein
MGDLYRMYRGEIIKDSQIHWRGSKYIGEGEEGHEAFSTGKKRKNPDSKGKGKQEEPDVKENLRYNLIFQTTAKDTRESKTIAIVEFKKPDQIEYENFKQVLLAESANRKEKAKQSKIPMGLLGNAESYSKQVCTYAQLRHVPMSPS